MASNTVVKMDVDNPLVLKRSSSAPMINELNIPTTPQTSTVREPASLPLCTGVPRMRRFSASFSPLSGPSSPKLTPRVTQLRREESVDVIGREFAHERELNSAMVMSQSWEDLTLVGDNTKDSSDMEKLSPLPPLCSTPSPTRPASVPLRHSVVFKPSLSPSPTRKFTTRRSQSPIQMRPSVLGPVKRKCPLEETEPPEPPAKKFSGLLIQQPRFEPVLKSPSLDGSLGGFDRLSQESAVPAAKAD